MIDVVWLPPDSQWDQTMLKQIFSGELWAVVNGYEFKHHEDFYATSGDGLILVIPGRYWGDKINQINRELSKYKWALVIVTGDEANIFPVKEIDHPNYKLWVQTPRANVDYGDARLFGVGYTPHTHHLKEFSEEASERTFDVFLSAQNTHDRRKECFEVLNSLGHDYITAINETKGFTQGLEPKEYYRVMANSKIVPAPSGAISPDSFRAYEALESGCIPILDDISPTYESRGYWNKLLGHNDIIVLQDYRMLQDYIDLEKSDWKHSSNKIFAWWQNYKRNIAYWMKEDLDNLTGDNESTEIKDRISVFISASPIPSHPDTSILEETLQSVRKHLPDSEIFVCFDGIREEQSDSKEDYEEFKRRMFWKINHEMHNVLPIVFTEHVHQANMLRECLNYVKTTQVLFIEADTPLVMDKEIEWQGVSDVIESKEADVVRFYPEKHILEPHKHLMKGKPKRVGDVRLLKTVQFSARPHLASVSWYRHVLNQYFPLNSRTFTEDKLHGVCQQNPWFENKLWIYHPNEQTQFSYDLDGRQNDPKFDVDFGSFE